MKGFFITILVLVVIFVIGIYYWTRDNISVNQGEENTFCTLDAKVCPDRSYVGRVPPTCEFAACPVATSSGTMMEDGVSATGSAELEIKY